MRAAERQLAGRRSDPAANLADLGIPDATTIGCMCAAGLFVRLRTFPGDLAEASLHWFHSFVNALKGAVVTVSVCPAALRLRTACCKRSRNCIYPTLSVKLLYPQCSSWFQRATPRAESEECVGGGTRRSKSRRGTPLPSHPGGTTPLRLGKDEEIR